MVIRRELSAKLTDSEKQKYLEEFNLPFDIIYANIENLQISENLKTVLVRIGVDNLFDLLILDYSKIAKERNIGETYLRELKDYVHGLGFTLKNEWPYLSEILEQKRREGVVLLEEYGLSSRVYLTLYHNGIYSFNDVLSYGPKINDIKSFGPLRRKELADKMAELGISFNVDEKSIDSTVAKIPYDVENNEKKIAALAAQDQYIAKLKEKRELLIKQYTTLEEEKDRLYARLEEIEHERAHVVTSFLER